ncbi:hypothetical protein [Nonomuraea zeae]|uniref:WD40 repeat domain-containing protein n=1 Tax=Nonomuraea zeae TaxID=1642303 RepID=A0A5S4FXI7_9ACTN|nr:hypothetical protein [Nonomuraea zeae]TMR25398.1 hypothetical protein ETD85_45370 [Nonomuraea zeae]
MRGEQDLIRTLRTAADQVERRDLAEGVARRRRARRTRQRVQVLLAAVAVVAIAGGTTAVLSGEDRQPPPPAVTVTPSAPETSVPKTRPAAELWPQAVVKVPVKNAKGWKTYPVTGLSATEVLLVANSAFEKAGRLEVYDSVSGTIRVLGDIPSPRKKYYPQHIAVGAEYIAWYGETPQDSDDWADFWIMPREGGKARRVGEVAADVERIAVTGDSLVWSVKEGGVYRMPLTGGVPERLPGTDGLRLSAWPWAAARSGDRPDANQTRVVNLETGQSSDVSLPEGVRVMQCHAQWCVGVLDDRVIVQRVDGSERKSLPRALRPHGLRLLLGDRYAVLRPYEPDRNQAEVPVAVVYDLATGLMAGVGERSAGPVSGGVGTGASSSAPSTTVSWDADLQYYEKCGKAGCTVKTRGGGKEYTVLNLAAVTR